MVAAPIPMNEAARVQELLGFDILDTLPEQAYDDLTMLATKLCEAPIGLITFVDADRQWFKSRVGLDATQTARDVAISALAILEPTELLIVPDTREDDRFAENPLVADQPGVRFYAGVPLVTRSGNAVGTLCVMDTEPRELTEDHRRSLVALGRQTVAQLELRSMQLGTWSEERYEGRFQNPRHELEASFSQLDQLALTDPLNGLHNRKGLMERLAEECSRAVRYGDELSFAIIDLDGVTAHGDSGAAAGERVLEAASRLIGEQSRASDFVARYGSSEFAVIFANTGTGGARVLAERIRSAIEHADWGDEAVTASIGIAAAGLTTPTPTMLIEGADRALYEAKAAGLNRVVLASV